MKHIFFIFLSFQITNLQLHSKYWFIFFWFYLLSNKKNIYEKMLQKIIANHSNENIIESSSNLSQMLSNIDQSSIYRLLVTVVNRLQYCFDCCTEMFAKKYLPGSLTSCTPMASRLFSLMFKYSVFLLDICESAKSAKTCLTFELFR